MYCYIYYIVIYIIVSVTTHCNCTFIICLVKSRNYFYLHIDNLQTRERLHSLWVSKLYYFFTVLYYFITVYIYIYIYHGSIYHYNSCNFTQQFFTVA